jgi:hypothetical protein
VPGPELDSRRAEPLSFGCLYGRYGQYGSYGPYGLLVLFGTRARYDMSDEDVVRDPRALD